MSYEEKSSKAATLLSGGNEAQIVKWRNNQASCAEMRKATERPAITR